jgi:hypothetical protein
VFPWKSKVAMILAAIVPAFGCSRPSQPLRTKAEVAKRAVLSFATEVYAAWSVMHPDQICPGSIEQLAEYTSRSPMDPWGHPYLILCRSNSIDVQSSGEDGTPGTGDDVSSAEK